MNILFWLNENFNLLKKVHTLIGMTTNWKPELEISEKATIEELNFVFDQATKRVEQSAQEGDTLYSKGITIISICLTALSALAGYMITHFRFTPALFASIAISIVLLMAVSALKCCVTPTKYRGSGSLPKDLLVRPFYENLNNRSTEWYMKMNEIIMYQERLEMNTANNNRRNDGIGKCFKLLYSLPVVISASLMFYYFLSLFF